MDERPGRGRDDALPAPDGLVRGPRAPSLSSRLDAWLADARTDGSADARARERWLRAAADADATLAGVLLDLAERQAAVTAHMAGGRRHHGEVGVVGADFVALRGASGEVLLSLAALASVRTAPSVEPAVGARVVTTELRLAEVLAELAAERARVLLVSSAGRDSVVGELRSVGLDVVALRTDADPPTTAYVATAAVAEVTLA